MTILRFLLPAILLLTPLWADSPITSTDFYVVYQDNKLVSRARETRLLDSEMLRFISNRYEPVDVKAVAVSQEGQQFLDANLAGHKMPAVLGEHGHLEEHFEQLASQHKSPRTSLGPGLSQQAVLFVLQQ